MKATDRGAFLERLAAESNAEPSLDDEAVNDMLASEVPIPSPLERVKCSPRSGSESLSYHGRELPFKLRDFWCWATSDLLSNATRGVFAEFIVAAALDAGLDGIREEWGAFDILTDDGIKVEVKSAAYIQSWHQTNPSKITFRVPRTRAWSAETSVMETEVRRQADVYVFALLFEQASIPDPLNLDHWEFYVLPTSALNARTRSQHSITLRTLQILSGGSVNFPDLREAVSLAAAANSR